GAVADRVAAQCAVGVEEVAVVATAANQGVVARAAGQGVVAGAAGERVIETVPGQDVVAAAADGVLDAAVGRQGEGQVGVDRLGRGCPRGEVAVVGAAGEVDGGIPVGVDVLVAPRVGAGVEKVVVAPAAARGAVVAGPADEDVGPGAAGEAVVAGAADDVLH